MLLVEPGFAGHWGFLSRKIDLSSGQSIDLDPIDLNGQPDCLRHLVRPGAQNNGAGVVVAVIDSGVGPHPDLPTAIGDPDTSIGHGTHVAGIIAGSGQGGLGGVAPGATIRSYRVFDDPATGVARNFEVHQAIVKAAADGCHIINLSLKSENRLDPTFNDIVISKAIDQASNAGVLVVAAAGNDFRRFVAFPARHPDVIAVSAIGWEPGLPANAYDRWTVSGDRSESDSNMFFATFSNEGVSGTGIAMTAPGAGVVSTVPGNRYAPMSGTSMACPAAVGAIARLLSANPSVLAMPPDRTRRDAIWSLVAAKLASVGLGAPREGAGMLV
jgi:subtilisin